MVQIIDKYGNTSSDYANLIVIDKNGIVKKIDVGGATPTGPAGGDLSGTYPNPTVVWSNGSPTYNSLYYPLSTNPAGFITSAALSPYLTSATAALTYYPIPTGTTSQYIRGDGSIVAFPTIPTITPAALTKTDDTNVTLTLGGSPSTALLQATSLTLGWTGTLADSRIASASTWNTKQNAITLTTTGTSGNATFVGSTLNIPNYSTDLTGYVQSTRTISTSAPLSGGGDLSANRTLSITQATTSTDGFLSSTNWNTFNNKFTLPALTSGSVLFSNGTTIAQDNANFFWDDTNNRLGINNPTPTNPLTIGPLVAASLQASAANFYSSKEGASNDFTLVASADNPLHRSVFGGRKSRGTLLSPTAVLAGDAICTFISGAYDGAAVQSSAALSFDAESAASIGSAPQLINFITGSTGANRTTKMQVRSNGNVIIQNGGTFTDAGFRLDVNGTARVSGGLTMNNFSSITSGVNGIEFQTARIIFSSNASTFDTQYKFNFDDGGGNNINTSGTTGRFQLSSRFGPTSGTCVYNTFLLNATINQTGGANGITRGLYINPTLTAAADFRAIEVANGITILGASTTAKASLRIPSGTAPTSPTNGDIWFDGTDLKMRIGGVTKTFTLL